MFLEKGDILFTDMGDGITRRALGHGERIMCCTMRFPKGAYVAPHSHEVHEQLMVVLEGSFEFTCDDKKRVLTKGECYYARPNESHSTLSLEDGSVLLDVHTPLRMDILQDKNSVVED